MHYSLPWVGTELSINVIAVIRRGESVRESGLDILFFLGGGRYFCMMKFWVLFQVS